MNNTDFDIRWYNRLQFRVLAIFLVMFLLIMMAIIMIANTLGEDLVERQAYLKLSDAGHRVMSELGRRTTQAATLVDSMARAAVEVPVDNDYFASLIKQLIDHPTSQHLVAGGGVWPEPYEFHPNKTRDSFFWGRNQEGDLLFYDDYNSADGAGYHHEEWYVPTKYLKQGEAYWSKSYIDPYSMQPMVTVSAPMYRQSKNIGVATIDLKLEGLQELLHEATREFGGYAFAVDRNGRFLSFPDSSLAQHTEGKVVDGSLASFLTVVELAEKQAEFKAFSLLLNQQEHSLSQQPREYVEKLNKLANALATESYQIQAEEAKLIAATLLDPDSYANQLDYHEQDKLLTPDYFFKEAAFVYVTTMPKTYWRIVTVMPESAARKEAVELFNLFIRVTIIAVLIAISLVWLLLRNSLTRPLVDLSGQLQDHLRDGQQTNSLIETSDKNEIGALAHWFNLRSQQLQESQEQIQHMAFFDALTGLPNRRMLLDRLEKKMAKAERHACTGALLFIDLDDFKHLNDSLGHNVGDELLIQVGHRFKDCLRDEDTIARIGGDEFVVMTTEVSLSYDETALQATEIARRIINVLSQSFELAGNQYHVTASIGISLFPKEYQGVEEILKQADAAMYQVKASGRNNFCFFEDSMQKKADEQLRIQAELRLALDGNKLELHYQPQLDGEAACSGVEALVRWHHPDLGQIPPSVFIPIAEESVLILSLGRWVLFEACRQINRWNEQGMSINHVAVNVSPRQFQQNDFIEDVKLAIEEAHIRPQQLMLEVTEGVILENREMAISKMHELKALGVTISLDDFGTGYSSLTYLKQLPLDQLKIDQSFVRDITIDNSDAVIVETIIAMAQHLGYQVIAEGVETEQQQQLLREKGCLHYQGYYFSRPLSVGDVTNYLKQLNNISA